MLVRGPTLHQLCYCITLGRGGEEEDASRAGGGGRENFKGRMCERTGNGRKWRWRRRQPRNGARTGSH